MQKIFPILILYWGSKVKYSYISQGKTFHSVNASVGLETLNIFDTEKIENFYLYLRKLSTLTIDEASHIAKLALDEIEETVWVITKENDGFTIEGDLFQIEVFEKPFSISVYNKQTSFIEPTHNISKIVNYLRSKGYDCDNLLETLATELK